MFIPFTPFSEDFTCIFAKLRICEVSRKYNPSRKLQNLLHDTDPIVKSCMLYRHHCQPNCLNKHKLWETRHFIKNSNILLSDFINLTQVHNFTVSAQDLFTFRRLSVFTVSFTGILQLLMQIMKHFVPSYWLVKWLWYRVYNQKVVSSSPRECFCFFYLYMIRLISFIIDVL